jgi:type II secretory pathway predicted ATPase ExeA
MNDAPFPFQDFVRAVDVVERATTDGSDRYLLVTGETGSGKSSLMAELRRRLDRSRFRIAYFSQTNLLGAMGLVRVLARILHLPTRRTHPETFREVVRFLDEEPQQLLLWFDDAQNLPQETLTEARSLVENQLAGPSRISVLFVGLPELRERLQAIPSLWRRVVVREAITGLVADEIEPFLAHHFKATDVDRCEAESLKVLFEQGRGVPGQILPMFRTVLARSKSKGRIDPEAIEEILADWDLP